MKLAGTRVLGIVACGVILSGVMVTDVSAQMLASTDRAFAAVNFGSQSKARTLTISGSSPLYDETATFESTVGIGAAGIWDVSVGVRVWSNLAIGVGYSRYRDSSDAVVTASVPDPLFFDAPHDSSTPVNGLVHQEGQLHLSAYWLVPVTDKFDIALSGGPTLFSVKQDLPSGITVAPGTADVASVTSSTVDESSIGMHAGADFRYLITSNLGVGAFLRYTSGSVKAALFDGGTLDVGGFQYGAGLRLRF